MVQFVKVSGGMQGGSHPPAFKRAEKKRLEEAKKEAADKSLVLWEGNDDPTAIKTYQRRSKGRGQGRGTEMVVYESSGDLGMDFPLATALPSSQRKIKLKERARGGVEESEVKQDSPGKKRKITEDINDVAADIAALIDVPVPVLEKRQLDIRAEPSGAGESSGVTGDADGDGGDMREADGGIPEAPIQDGEADDIEEEEDNETLSDIDDDEVIFIPFLRFSLFDEISSPQYVTDLVIL